MQYPDSIDRYFTEQVVGRPFTVVMGPSAGLRQQPTRGVLVTWLGGRVELVGVALRSLWAESPADAVLGQPLSLPGLVRWRRGLLAAAWLLWSAILAAVVWSLHP